MIQSIRSGHFIEVLQPKADVCDDLIASDATYCLRDAAKSIHVAPQREFISDLETHGFLRRQTGTNILFSRQRYVNQGIFEVPRLQPIAGTRKDRISKHGLPQKVPAILITGICRVSSRNRREADRSAQFCVARL